MDKITATVLAGRIEIDQPDTIVEWVMSISRCIEALCSQSARTIFDKASKSLVRSLFEHFRTFSEFSDDDDDDSFEQTLKNLFKPVVENLEEHVTSKNILIEMRWYFPIYERVISLLRYDYGDNCIDTLEKRMGLTLLQFYIYCLNVFFDKPDVLIDLFSKDVVIPDNDIKKLMKQATVEVKSIMLKRKVEMDAICDKLAHEVLDNTPE